MYDLRGNFLQPPHGTTPAAVITKMFRTLQDKENIHEKEGGLDCTVLNDNFSSRSTQTSNICVREVVHVKPWREARSLAFLSLLKHRFKIYGTLAKVLENYKRIL